MSVEVSPAVPTDPAKPVRILRRVLIAVAAVSALYVAALTLYSMRAVYLPQPFWDQWGNLTLQDYVRGLVQQHNEHRLVVFNLISIMDVITTRGGYGLNFVCSILFQAVSVAIIGALPFWAGLRRPGDVLWAYAIALGYLFWGAQWENFFWGFQTQFFAVYLGGILAFTCLAALPSWTGVVAATAAALFALGSMSNGAIVPILLPVLSLWLRRPSRETGALAAAAVVMIGIYLIGYTSPTGHASPFASLLKPLGVLSYLATYLGNPFMELILQLRDKPLRQPEMVAMVAGGFGIALALASAVLLLVRPALATAPRLVLLHIAAFVGASGFITALGRLNFGLSQALSSRYQTPALIFWVSLIFLVWTLVPPRLRLVVPTSATLALVLMLATGWTYMAGKVGGTLFQRGGAYTAMLSDVRDDVAFAGIAPAAGNVIEGAKILREKKLALFAGPWSSWLGTPLTSHVAIVPASACIGAFDTADPVLNNSPGTAYRVMGWAWDPHAKAPVEKLVVANAGGIVVGYALTDVVRTDVPTVVRIVTALKTGWRGHARLAGAADTLTVYALLSDGKSACPLPGPKTVGP